jgi:3-dehydroquinate synthase
MKNVKVNTQIPYDVKVGSGILEQAGKWIAECVSGRKVALVADALAMAECGETLKKSLSDAGFTVIVMEIGEGEGKTAEEMMAILRQMADRHMTRSDAVVALGGGITGNVAGMAAALYQRGISCIQIPTTLLSMVDSSVGGKLAVDMPQGQNMIGVVRQPALVICDISLLKDLRSEKNKVGWSEIIKTGMIGNRDLLDFLAEYPEGDRLEDVVAMCVSLKGAIVARDEDDTGERMVLNFGHTVGHAIESLSGGKTGHGAAVAIGMAVMTRAFVRKGTCTKETRTILESLLDHYGLPKTTEYTADQLFEAAKSDKKRRDDRITLIVPEFPGKCVLREMKFSELKDILALGLPEMESKVKPADPDEKIRMGSLG